MTELPDRLLRDALDDSASATPSAACLGVDTLAAWADGTLNVAERAAAETHAATCARCLALLAAMTRTEPPPVTAWWRRSPIAWLLPLAAVTAGLVIVVRLAVLEQRQATSTPTAATAAAPSPRVDLPPAVPLPAQSPVTSTLSRSSAGRQKHERVAAPAGRATLPDAEAAAKDSTASAQRPAPAQIAPAPASPTPLRPIAPPTSAATPVPAPQSDPVVVTAAAGEQVAGGRRGARAFAADRAIPSAAGAASGSIVIASPDRNSLWRIVGGTVEHTADGGATWQPQASGVATPMRAGAAPDGRVCWLAGAEGVVLRTTDGTTWTRIRFPEESDLVAVQATDAAHATVTTADGRRVATNDGGATWVRQ